MIPRPRYIVVLEPGKHVVDPVRALRRALKALLRSYGLKAISVEETPGRRKPNDTAAKAGGL